MLKLMFQPLILIFFFITPSVFASSQYDKSLFIIMLGGSDVGKSALHGQIIRGKFQEPGQKTIGIELYPVYHQIGRERLKVMVLDTAGKDIYHSITRSYYRRTQGAILVYSVDNVESFKNIKSWAADILKDMDSGSAYGSIGNPEDEKNCLSWKQKNCEQNFPMILVANKMDLDDKFIKISQRDGATLATELNIPFFEVSAKTGYGVKEAFDTIVSMVNKTVCTSASKNNSINLDGQEATQCGCCI